MILNKKRILTSNILLVLILSVITLAAFSLNIFLKPVLREDMFLYIIFELVITPIVYGVGATVLLLILNIWNDLAIKNGKIRKLLLALSTILITLYILGVIYFIMTFNNLGYPLFCWTVIIWLLQNPFVFSLLSIAFFFAVNKYREKTNIIKDM